MMIEKNPEMMQKMLSKILDKITEIEKGCKMPMDKTYNNKMMKVEMKRN